MQNAATLYTPLPPPLKTGDTCDKIYICTEQN